MDASIIPFGQYYYGGLSINIPPLPPSDAELTNLNWVAGAPVPMQNPVSPKRKGAAFRSKHTLREDIKINSSVSNTKQSQISNSKADTNHCEKSASTIIQQSKSEIISSKRDKRKADGGKSIKSKNKGEQHHAVEDGEEPKEKKPNCSYTSLIGLALMASNGGCLPVSEIYTYIEDEFPYFRSAPDGWKNSIRHNLSLNPAFRKVKDSIRWQGKKGYYWEVTPERRTSVEREVERYLRQEGKLTDTEQDKEGVAPFPRCLHASIPAMPHTPSINSIPMFPFQFCTGTQPYYDIASSMQRHYPPQPVSQPLPHHSPTTAPVKTCNTKNLTIPPATTAMVTLLDTNLSPGQFAGFSDPTCSTANSALHDLFGLHISSPKPLPNITQQHHHNSTNYVYTQPHACTHVVDSFGFQPHYTSPCPCLDDPSNNYLMVADNHTIQRRKQALNQLTIPQENNWTNTDCIDNSTPPSINDYNCLSSSSSSYCSHQQPHCKESPFECCDGVTLEDCFVMDVGDQSPVGHCNDISHNSVEFCGELPLPPSVHAGMSSSENKELERKVESSNGNVTETVDSAASPMLPSSNEHGDVHNGSCGVKRSSRRSGGRVRRKRRRLSNRNRLPQTSSASQRAQKVEDSNDEKKLKVEEQDGHDMLSCVNSNSEQEMRDSLSQTGAAAADCVLHATCTVITNDGLYSPPRLRHSSTLPQQKSLLAQ